MGLCTRAMAWPEALGLIGQLSRILSCTPSGGLSPVLFLITDFIGNGVLTPSSLMLNAPYSATSLMWTGSYPSRALCASASTSSVDIAVMSWAVANGLLRVKLLGTPFDGQSVEP